jgi:hypothetical protein
VIRRAAVTALCLSVAFTTACKSPEQKAAEETAKRIEEAGKQMEAATKNGQVNLGDAMNAVGAAMGGANGGKKVDVVEYKVLKDMLPESVAGMKRTDASGEKTAAMGMQVSNAEGRYSNDQNGGITIKLTDIGSMTGLAGMAAYAWASTSVERESDNGYEKTGTFNGFRSHEQWEKSSSSGQISVLVGGRFVAEASGYNTSMDALKDALGKIDLKKLDGMKNEGVH